MVNLDDLQHLNLGKRTRLHRMMYEYGPGNGTLLILPIDQGMEHGPVDFFTDHDCLNPEYQFRLAVEGGYSGIALHLGLAEKYGPKFAGKIPIVLKINGKTRIPSSNEPVSPMTGSVEDAVRIGADAVGYTLYVGSPKQHTDFTQFRKVKEDAERYGIPIIVWAYPRGDAVDSKGGRDSLYAIDYAARVSDELGADVVKLNVPVTSAKSRSMQPPPYDTLNLSTEDMVAKVVKSAGKTLVIFSGGGMATDEEVIERAKICMEQGATGLIFGRNLWQRNWDDALKMTKLLKDIMLKV
ncbi:MAG: class I fructose-bisphosphate aldolase [Candidatus Thorarchaeota archaeon SMTZ1-45]|nr:MAG: fructose-bisphosphate aldolase [Candidatus Thorarchaeota archaeon SMTZ1-45]